MMGERFWSLKMAWRDARRERRKLFFCMLSIVFGVAALVVVQSFGHNMRRGLDHESKALLGADLVIRSAAPFSERAEALFARLGGAQDREVRFTSMAFFPEYEDTRLVLVRALQGGFPFYGDWVVETERIERSEEPEARSQEEAIISHDNPGNGLARAERPVALVDDSLFLQFGLQVGDTLQLGDATFEIVGRVKGIAGESAFSGVFAPRVYIGYQHVAATGLLQFGSVVRHRAYFQMPDGVDMTLLNRAVDELFATERLRYETVDTRKERIGAALDNVYRFLQLVGWIALLLGAIGIAGAVHVYLQSKFEAVALLRCLGVSRRGAFFIYGLQVMAVAWVGVLLGAGVGALLQSFLPGIIAPFLPFELAVFFSWRSIGFGVLFGFVVALLFSLLPLLPIRNVSALQALRMRVEGGYVVWKDRIGLVLLALIGGLFLALSLWQVTVWWHGIVFCAGCGIVFGVLYGFAGLLRSSLQVAVRGVKSFVIGQGIKNLYRPNNRTLFVMVALGMGTFLVFTLYLVEFMLLNQSELVGRDDEPNLLFFDVQWDQRAEVHALIEAEGLAVLDEAPVVTMRLVAIKGRTVSSIRKDPDAKIEPWILNREWRSTYRSEVKASTESIVAGTFAAQWDGLQEPVPISMERGMAEDLGIWVDDNLVFNVQGIEIETVVTSIREVNWQRMRSNFFTVFPAGVLEDAPTYFLAFTRTGGVEATAALQRKVVDVLPNVMTIDLGLIVGTLQKILDKVSYVIRFMGSFAIVTGLVVLAGAVITSRYQRARESVLLRTMGASAKQILGIVLVEYVLLGVLSAAVGIILSCAAAWGLGVYVFKLDGAIPLVAVGVAFLLVTVLTTLIGMINSYAIATRPPLDVLRDEVF